MPANRKKSHPSKMETVAPAPRQKMPYHLIVTFKLDPTEPEKPAGIDDDAKAGKDNAWLTLNN